MAVSNEQLDRESRIAARLARISAELEMPAGRSATRAEEVRLPDLQPIGESTIESVTYRSDSVASAIGAVEMDERGQRSVTATYHDVILREETSQKPAEQVVTAMQTAFTTQRIDPMRAQPIQVRPVAGRATRQVNAPRGAGIYDTVADGGTPISPMPSFSLAAALLARKTGTHPTTKNMTIVEPKPVFPSGHAA